MWEKKKIKLVFSVAILSILIILSSCDIYKSEEKEISGVDKTVCEQFSDSVFTNISSVTIETYFPDTMDVDLPAVLSNFLDSLIVDSIFIEQNANQAFELTLATLKDTTYIGIDLKKDGMVLFTTDVFEVHLFKKDGNELKLTNETMPLETVSGCTELTEGGVVEPIIKMRQVYNTDNADNVLMQIIKLDQTKSKTFKVSVQ